MNKNSLISYNNSTPDIGSYFEQGLNLFKQNIAGFMIVSILFWAVSIFSFSILFGPLFAGYMLFFVNTLRENNPKPFDIFKGLYKLVPLIIAFYFTSILISIGTFFLVIPGLIFISWFFFVELLILDKNIGIFKAMKLNKKMSSDRGILNYMILNFVLVLSLTLLGSLSFGLGTILISPVVFAIYAVAYEDSFGEQIGVNDIE